MPPLEKHGIGKLTEIDNVDDRKEIYYLLTLLTVQERFTFLDFTIKVINEGIVFQHDPPHILLTVTQETGSVSETYMDLMLAISKYNIPVPILLQGLVNYVRKLEKLTENHRVQALQIPIQKLLG